jgi:hypothetical protein
LTRNEKEKDRPDSPEGQAKSSETRRSKGSKATGLKQQRVANDATPIAVMEKDDQVQQYIKPAKACYQSPKLLVRQVRGYIVELPVAVDPCMVNEGSRGCREDGVNEAVPRSRLLHSCSSKTVARSHSKMD